MQVVQQRFLSFFLPPPFARLLSNRFTSFRLMVCCIDTRLEVSFIGVIVDVVRCDYMSIHVSTVSKIHHMHHVPVPYPYNTQLAHTHFQPNYLLLFANFSSTIHFPGSVTNLLLYENRWEVEYMLRMQCILKLLL